MANNVISLRPNETEFNDTSTEIETLDGARGPAEQVHGVAVYYGSVVFAPSGDGALSIDASPAPLLEAF